MRRIRRARNITFKTAKRNTWDMIQKQTVYLPVKIDDEFWTKWDNGEKPDYDLSNVDTGESIESWVNKKEGYFFTPEQLNEYTANVIKQALETAAEKAMIIAEPDLGKETIAKEISISKYDKLFHETVFYTSKQSITDTFEETFKKFKHD